MIIARKAALLLAILLVMIALAACGGYDDELAGPASGGESARVMWLLPRMKTRDPRQGPWGPTRAGAITQDSDTAATGTETPQPRPGEGEAGEAVGQSISMSDARVAQVSQNRIIVRTVDMLLIVDDVAESVDRVAEAARQFGGWVVSSERTSTHSAFVAIRVPAELLEDTVLRLRQVAKDVEYETSTSKDVTDEYVDSQARLRSLEATETALLALLNRAGSVKDALEIQKSLSEIQAEKETMQGRIRFLQETSAFSLLNVNLQLLPVAMPVIAGPDQTFSIGQIARFRATFDPPEGVDDFTFTWDFGDGTQPVTGTRTAPNTEGRGRVTATVNHTYSDDRDSPYIVQLEVAGAGDSGLAEGSDTLTATVTKIPSIEVFTGEDRTQEEGKEGEYTGSFTRPEGLWDIQYRWDFGDGSPSEAGVPDEGITRATTTHAYANHRANPYSVTLTVTAQSEAGKVEGSSSFEVTVTESEGLIIGGWSAGNTGKSAIRALSALGQGLGTIIIWLGVFSPVWLIGIGVAYLIYRRQNQFFRQGAGSVGASRGLETGRNPGRTQG